MPSTRPEQLHSRAEIGILTCSKCGNPMRSSQIEPAAPGYDVRTFECVKCDSSERFSVAI
jgi:ribosomal protein L37AE/L43A